MKCLKLGRIGRLELKAKAMWKICVHGENDKARMKTCKNLKMRISKLRRKSIENKDKNFRIEDHRGAMVLTTWELELVSLKGTEVWLGVSL